MGNERYKGKPKTKTKQLRETRVSLAVGEVSMPQTSCLKQVQPAQQAGRLQKLMSRCCCLEEAANYGAPTTIGGDSQQEKDFSEIVGRSVEPQISINLAQLTEVAEDAGGTISKQDPPVAIESAADNSTADSTKSLDDVRENFITLISFNKLQYFILGALIYTVMVIAIIFLNYILHLNNYQDKAPTNSAHLAPSVQRESPQSNLTNQTVIGLLIFGLYLLLLVVLSVMLAIVTLEFSKKHQEPKQRNRSRAWPRTTCLLVALLLVHLQSIVNLLINFGYCCFQNLEETNDLTYNNKTISEDSLPPIKLPTEDKKNQLEHRKYQQYWPIGSILVVIYLLPVLIEGDNWLDRRQWRTLLYLPSLLLAIIQFRVQHSALWTAWHSPAGDVALVQLVCLLLALLLGIRMRRGLVMAVTRATFAGAAQLIEAKVSLEHQRQQQETLLLSVLPAYVAEQVKRNMLKKTTSASSAASFDQDTCSIGGASNPGSGCVVPTIIAPNSQQVPSANSWKSRSFTALHGAFQSTDSAATVVVAPSVEISANKHSPQVVASGCGRQRNSFQLPTKALTSGLAAIGGTLGSGGDSSKRGSQTGTIQQQAVATNSTPGHHQQISCSSSAISPSAGQARRGFNELYIRTYNNVSLLYGDIVGFTRLCTQLSSSQLVRVLNDLFSHFDHLAERHRIMRIKILGDCYYGVSGIPEFAVMGAKSRASRNDNHAINCVNMGLDMIHYIRCLNVERASSVGGSAEQQTAQTAAGQCSPMPPFELNMRIGIHTGHIHSGVIGLKKWQFDVWSNDVSIAMHCESSGIAGRVQVTQATVQQLNGAFTYENAYGSKRDSFLASKDIRTYLIRDRVQVVGPRDGQLLLGHNPADSGAGKLIHNNSSAGGHMEWMEPEASRQEVAMHYNNGTKKFATSGDTSQQMMDEFNILAATIGTIRQILLAGETCNANGLNSYGLALNHHDIGPVTLRYHDQRIGKLYANRPLNNHPIQELATCVLVIPLLYLIGHKLDQPLPEWGHWFLVSTIVATVISFIIISKREHLVSKLNEQTTNDPLDLLEPHLVIKDRGQRKDRSSLWKFGSYALELARKFSRSFQFGASRLITLVIARLRPRMFATLLVFTCVIAILVNQWVEMQNGSYCVAAVDNSGGETINKWLQGEKYELTVILLLFWLNSTLNLLSYQTKSILILIMLGWHLVRMLLFKPNSNRWLCDLQHQASVTPTAAGSHQELMIDGLSDALLVAVMLWSLAYARQIEYTNKTNFLWRNRLNVDHEELEYISGINKVLLENILPSHVVQHYLTHPQPNEQPARNQLMPSLSAYMRMSFSNMRNQNDGLYHEQHDSVAVMFASIPHFYEFYDESDISKQGLGCIALLNEIICDFDKLLLKNKFSRIEKIKTIGSSYMAAAGLRPASNLSGSGRPSNASQCSVSSSIPSSLSPSKRAGASRQMTPNVIVPNNLRPDSMPCNSDQLLVDDRRLLMSQQKLNLICMVKFATSLMTALNGINKQSFQVFKLRIGVNTGPVIAGIIGAQRPFYDIWGDCVNIASRMESLGEVGRIQVEERTAKLLMDSLDPDTYSIVRRGPIDVKGKGGMVTYFVDRKEGLLVNDEPHNQQHQLHKATPAAQQVTDTHQGDEDTMVDPYGAAARHSLSTVKETDGDIGCDTSDGYQEKCLN